MKLLVIGATSRTGRHLVPQARERGHEVTVFCRDPARLSEDQRELPAVVGDARSASDVRGALPGHDAVAVILQADDTHTDRLVSDCVAALVAGMTDAGVPRIVLCSARPTTAVRPRLVTALLWLWLRDAYRDLVRAEGMLEVSGLDARIARPGRLTDGPATGRYDRGDDDLDASRARDLSRADLARAMLDLAEDPDAVGAAWNLGGAR